MISKMISKNFFLKMNERKCNEIPVEADDERV